MTRTALLVVDMLTDFFIAKPGLPVPVRMAPLLANTQKVCWKAREKDIPVVFANDSFQKTEVPIDRHFKHDHALAYMKHSTGRRPWTRPPGSPSSTRGDGRPTGFRVREPRRSTPTMRRPATE
jgi:nicotinamidase-related amidase